MAEDQNTDAKPKDPTKWPDLCDYCGRSNVEIARVQHDGSAVCVDCDAEGLQ